MMRALFFQGGDFWVPLPHPLQGGYGEFSGFTATIGIEVAAVNESMRLETGWVLFVL
jgi:hypothetical protein